MSERFIGEPKLLLNFKTINDELAATAETDTVGNPLISVGADGAENTPRL